MSDFNYNIGPNDEDIERTKSMIEGFKVACEEAGQNPFAVDFYTQAFSRSVQELISISKMIGVNFLVIPKYVK